MGANPLLGKEINVKVKLHNYRFPKDRAPIPGAFAIVCLDILEVISGVISGECVAPNGTITVTGEMPTFEDGMEYFLTATLTEDPKWGLQYHKPQVRLAYNMSKREDQEKFLSFFMTETQIKSLFYSYENPIELLEQKNIGALTKIKGIGPYTANKMCLKYAANINNGRAYVELKDMGLTKAAIDKLIKQFGSPDLVIDIIKKNPYSLITLVNGYGWEKADKIALAQGFERGCKERCLAYTNYKLGKIANEDGNSKMDLGELMEDVAAQCAPTDKQTLANWIKEQTIEAAECAQWEAGEETERDWSTPPVFYYDKTTRFFGLYKYRSLERKIAYELERLKTAPNRTSFDRQECDSIIRSVEIEQGYAFTAEQRKAIWSILDNNVAILTGSAGCVDKDTEFFTGFGWKKISEYSPGDKVLVYTPDGSAHLELPEKYIKLPASQLWLTQSKYGVDMCTCDEHNVYYLTSKGNLYHKPFSEVREAHEKSNGGFSGKFLTTFNTDEAGIDLSDAEIKIMLAVIADGSFYKNREGSYCRFHIKKERKKEELRKILQEAQIEWHEFTSAAPGYTDFSIKAPRREKIFSPDYWYKCSHRQLQLICDNVLKWDGSCCSGHYSFSTTEKANADFIQYAFASCGHRATIYTNDRRGKERRGYYRKSIEYEVNITSRTLVSIGGFHRDNANKIKIVPYTTKDGFKYCFTVSSHMWVMRRNGKILITGNCGKSSTLKPIVRIFQHFGYKVAQCALSGRASSLLTEYTGLTGKTIHRLLRYLPDLEKFDHNKSNPLLEDVILLDEASMVGEELFYSLISSIRSGCKLLMLGDIKQLPPIAVGNLLQDCIASGYIPTTTLTVIQRQALKSGIISQSVDVCKGTRLIQTGYVGEEIRGELKDFKIIAHDDASVTHAKVIQEFKKLYTEQHISPDDIQIVVPVRAKGMNSCRFFNAEVQALVNNKPDTKGIPVEVWDGSQHFEVVYKPGDRIMVTKNNYHARNLYGGETAIFNGNLGHIKDIDKESMLISLNDGEEVIIPRDEWNNITHSWAATCHKLQGAQAPYVIVSIDNSAYPLLMREWLYTALTRARKYCVLIGQPNAINTATRVSNIKIKKTWLKEDLYELYMDEQKQKGA